MGALFSTAQEQQYLLAKSAHVDPGLSSNGMRISQIFDKNAKKMNDDAEDLLV